MKLRTFVCTLLPLVLAVIWILASAPPAEAAVCGNSVVEPGETCDPPDGNCCLPNCICNAGASPCSGGVCFPPFNCRLSGTACACGGAACPLARGQYTLTTTGAGFTEIGNSGVLPRVVGETLVLDVGAGDANCVHEVVVPDPGGYSIPITCLAGIVTVQGFQAGCGRGWLDSDGGSDFTITETGDTSSPTCGLSHPGCTPGADISIRRDVKVGNGAADSCPSGTANLLVSVPIGTQGWIDGDGHTDCPDEDGQYDAGIDVLVSTQTPTVNFTTDTSSAGWAELPGDSDSCFLAGVGPASGFSATGACLDYATGTISLAATQPLGGNNAASGNDATFRSLAVDTFVPSGPFAGASCASLPGGNLILGSTRKWCIP